MGHRRDTDYHTEWKLDPAKLGIMGFSAGAELSAPAALFFEDFERDNSDPANPLAKVSARPDFVGVIDPGPTPLTRDPATRIPPPVSLLRKRTQQSHGALDRCDRRYR